jgi:hypothetical protein
LITKSTVAVACGGLGDVLHPYIQNLLGRQSIAVVSWSRASLMVLAWSSVEVGAGECSTTRMLGMMLSTALSTHHHLTASWSAMATKKVNQHHR